MKRLGVILIGLACIASFPFGVSAQKATAPTPLSTEQQEGRRIFQRKCAVCHVPVSGIARQYSPPLYKGVVQGRELTIRQTIANGKGDGMPGWRFTLQPAEIDGVISYLKTLDGPPRTVASEHP